MNTADVAEAADIASAIISRRPLFADHTLPWSEIDALADDEERDLAALADAGPGDLLHKARAMMATSFIRNSYSEPSPGELALLLSILAAVCGFG